MVFLLMKKFVFAFRGEMRNASSRAAKTKIIKKKKS